MKPLLVVAAAMIAASVPSISTPCRAEMLFSFASKENAGARDYDFDVLITNNSGESAVIQSFNLAFDLGDDFAFKAYDTSAGEGSFNLNATNFFPPVDAFPDVQLASVNTDSGGGLSLLAGQSRTLLSMTLEYTGSDGGDLLAATLLTTGVKGRFTEVMIDDGGDGQAVPFTLGAGEVGPKLSSGVVPEPSGLLIGCVLVALAGLRRPERRRI